MPKKRTYNFKQLQGASSTSTSKGSGASRDESASLRSTGSVNERLGELRKIEGSEAAQVKRELAESVNLRSVPPQLRGILGVPESAPPKPKFGARSRLTNPRIAGPAPPQSWLRARSHGLPMLTLRARGRKFKKLASQAKDRQRPPRAWAFAQQTLSDACHGQPNSLLHLSLKVAAQQWELFEEADFPALADLDLRLRIKLISYIGMYGPSLSIKEFGALTQGYEPITFLDLGGLLGHGTLTSARLLKAFKAQTPETAAQSKIADSWEEEVSFEAALTLSPSVSRFSNLTHLSLSHPASGVSWRDLLSLSKQSPKLTHLSLAYWPRPTLTPNLATATVSSGRSPDVNAGGSHMYSSLDQDHSEPASLLRQLSANLLCLQWLDLEGCASWMPALAVHNEWASAGVDDPEQSGVADSWLHTSRSINLFLDHWKNVTYVRCSQGWMPSKQGLDALPRQLMDPAQRTVVLECLRSYPERSGSSGEGADGMYEIAKRKAQIWADCEMQAVTAGRHINAIRRVHGLKPVVIDHGWRKKII